MAEWSRLSDLFAEARCAFDLVTPDGKVNTSAVAQARFAAALSAMGSSEEGRALAAKLRPMQAQRFFAHLDALAKCLDSVCLEEVGAAREARLARLVAETVAWRRHDKDAVDILRAASTGSLADTAELAVIQAVDMAMRSSSAVEYVTSRIRLVQVARKRLGEDFLYLLGVYHNMHKFGRGSLREGKNPAELAGVELPTGDWIELLGLDGNGVLWAKVVETSPAGGLTAPASAQSAA